MNYLLIPIVPDPPKRARERASPVSRAEKAKAIYQYRRRREQHLPAELLGEPGWDMLLLLYFLAEEGTPISVAGLSAGSGVPSTTALRWQNALEKRGFLARQADPEDGRRIHVTLTDAGQRVMDALLDEYP